jgi:hypothetical protein
MWKPVRFRSIRSLVLIPAPTVFRSGPFFLRPENRSSFSWAVAGPSVAVWRQTLKVEPSCEVVPERLERSEALERLERFERVVRLSLAPDVKTLLSA